MNYVWTEENTVWIAQPEGKHIFLSFFGPPTISVIFESTEAAKSFILRFIEWIERKAVSNDSLEKPEVPKSFEDAFKDEEPI